MKGSKRRNRRRHPDLGLDEQFRDICGLDEQCRDIRSMDIRSIGRSLVLRRMYVLLAFRILYTDVLVGGILSGLWRSMNIDVQ